MGGAVLGFQFPGGALPRRWFSENWNTENSGSTALLIINAGSSLFSTTGLIHHKDTGGAKEFNIIFQWEFAFLCLCAGCLVGRP
jgi:hypothetical protein